MKQVWYFTCQENIKELFMGTEQNFLQPGITIDVYAERHLALFHRALGDTLLVSVLAEMSTPEEISQVDQQYAQLRCLHKHLVSEIEKIQKE